MRYYSNDKAVENIQPVDNSKRKIKVEVYRSDGTKETLKNVTKVVVDVEKTSGVTALDILDPDYTALESRIEKIEKGFLRNIFERIFK